MTMKIEDVHNLISQLGITLFIYNVLVFNYLFHLIHISQITNVLDFKETLYLHP